MDQNLISSHIFIFPFKWTSKSDLKKNDMHEIDKALQKNNWTYAPFDLNDATNYTEYIYFYKHAQQILFNTSQKIEKNNLHNTYKKVFTNAFYEIEVTQIPEDTNKCEIDDSDSKKYTLIIEDIELKIYSTGIGLLILNTNNYTHPEENSILEINDFGRKLFPSYLKNLNMNDYLYDIQQKFLPLQCTIKIDENSFVENFQAFNNISELSNKVNYIPTHILKILGENFTYEKNDTQKKILLENLFDDNMFIACWVGQNNSEHIEKMYDINEDNYNSNFLYLLTKIQSRAKLLTNHAEITNLKEQQIYSRFFPK